MIWQRFVEDYVIFWPGENVVEVYIFLWPGKKIIEGYINFHALVKSC